MVLESAIWGVIDKQYPSHLPTTHPRSWSKEQVEGNGEDAVGEFLEEPPGWEMTVLILLHPSSQAKIRRRQLSWHRLGGALGKFAPKILVSLVSPMRLAGGEQGLRLENAILYVGNFTYRASIMTASHFPPRICHEEMNSREEICWRGGGPSTVQGIINELLHLSFNEFPPVAVVLDGTIDQV